MRKEWNRPLQTVLTLELYIGYIQQVFLPALAKFDIVMVSYILGGIFYAIHNHSYFSHLSRRNDIC